MLEGIVDLPNEIYTEPLTESQRNKISKVNFRSNLQPQSNFGAPLIVRGSQGRKHIPLSNNQLHSFDEYDLGFPYQSIQTFQERSIQDAGEPKLKPQDTISSDQFIFPDRYVISQPDMSSTLYDRRLIIKLPANQPPDRFGLDFL